MSTATQLRSDVATLAEEANGELSALWRDVQSALAAETVLRDVLPSLIDEYGAMAATVAADWYDDLRDARGVRRRFTAIPADIPNPGAQALVGWALTEVNDPSDVASFRALIEGGMQRRIANFSRLTVSRSSIEDPSAHGWRRVGTPRCNFCRMLIGRGAVYTEATVDFESHDHCNCAAEPAWH